MRKIRLIALAAVLVATAAFAQQPKPESQIKLRKAAYDLMNYNFDNLDNMASGKKPYNREESIRNADFVAMLATVPRMFFGEGTDKGETRAKPEIWEHRADFDAKMDKMSTEAAKLPQVARGGDVAALRKQVEETEKACKACHDDYRKKLR
ncbi:MAG: c-type cytochrome [Bacillota bacterium]